MTESSEHISRVLDRCVQQLEQGATVDECLARNPAHQAELAELLPTVAGLRRAPRVTLSPASVRESRRHLLERLEPRPRPRWSLRSALPLGWRQSGQPLFAARRLTMAWILVIATVVSLMAGGGVVYASDAAVPGDFLYSLDRAVEEVRLGLASDGEAAFALQLSFAEERLAEANQLYAAGDTANAKTALTGYSDALMEAAREMTNADNTQGDALRVRLEAVANGLNNVGLEDPEGIQVQIRDRDRDRWCLDTSVEDHPVAVEIADMYDYDVSVVNEWFCDGAGLGEIMMLLNIINNPNADLAELEALAAAADMTLEEYLLGLPEEGQGWGQILQTVGLIGGELKQGQPDSPGQPEGEPGRKPDEAGSWMDSPLGPGEGDPNQAGQGGQPAEVGPDAAQPNGPQGQGAGGQSGGSNGGNGQGSSN